MQFLKDNRGGPLAEYGFIIALVALAVILGLSALGGNLSNFFNSIAQKFK